MLLIPLRVPLARLFLLPSQLYALYSNVVVVGLHVRPAVCCGGPMRRESSYSVCTYTLAIHVRGGDAASAIRDGAENSSTLLSVSHPRINLTFFHHSDSATRHNESK